MPDDKPTPPPQDDVCCRMRKKVALTPFLIPEEVCGVSDAELADFMIFDQKSPLGRPLIAFRFCPWCGKPWKLTGQVNEFAKPPEGEGDDEAGEGDSPFAPPEDDDDGS